MKSKHIDWTLGLKWVWPWPWPWPWILKVKFALSQPKMVWLPRKEKQTYKLNSKASKVTIRFDLGHDLDIEFSRSNMEFPISQPKVVRLPRNEKQSYRLNSRPQMWPIGFDHDHNHWILKVKRDLDLWPHTWPWPWIFMVKFWNSCISEWEGRLTSHKGGGSRSFMTMTIWWPRSGVWIYQIVTGVTSVVGVPSTHLVLLWWWGCWVSSVIWYPLFDILLP